MTTGPNYYPQRLVIALPLPSVWLSPNAPKPHSNLASFMQSQTIKKARTLAYKTALQYRLREPVGEYGPATITVDFYWRTNRLRDQANALASLKPYIDGIVDARVIPDDSLEHLIGPLFGEWHRDRDNPRVELLIEREPVSVLPSKQREGGK